MEQRSQATAHPIHRFALADIVLFARALGLARRAQRVRVDPVPVVVEDLVRRSSGPNRSSIDRLELASTRAVSRWRRWFGGIDSCLTRSLVLGTMLSGHGEVALNLGFRPGEEESSVDGHAWVTVDGQPVGRDGDLSRERYTRVIEIPFERESGAG